MKNIFTQTMMVLLLTLMSFIPTNLFAQDVVQKQVLEIGLLLALDGYQLTHDTKFANLNNGRSDDYYFNLSRGWQYQIIAVCDSDCGDIDLCLYDEYGGEIDCDAQVDDNPMVTATPKWTGRFRLNVKMYECKINPCKFGIAVFGK